MESNKNQASDGIKKQCSRKTQIHKMHPVFIEFYHFPVELILFTNNARRVFIRHLKNHYSLTFSDLNR